MVHVCRCSDGNKLLKYDGIRLICDEDYVQRINPNGDGRELGGGGGD